MDYGLWTMDHGLWTINMNHHITEKGQLVNQKTFFRYFKSLTNYQ